LPTIASNISRNGDQGTVRGQGENGEQEGLAASLALSVEGKYVKAKME
jgi:hypothetical protein